MKSRLLSILSFIVGIVLFFFLVRKAGVSEIAGRLSGIGLGFIAILGLAVFRQFARTYAWLRCMSDDDRALGFFSVWKARLAGDALSDLTAAGPLLGEPVKLAALGDVRRLRDLASSLAIENLLYGITCALIVVTGAASLLTLFGVEESIRTAGYIASAVSISIIFASFVIVRYRIAVLSSVAGWFSGMPGMGWLKGIVEAEQYIFDFFQFRRADFLAAMFGEICFHLVALAEMWLAVYLLNGSTSLLVAFVLESVNRAINLVFAFVPALVGVDEAGSGMVAAAVGLGSGVGISLALVRKCRMLIFIVIGLIFLVPGKRLRKI